jgi:8-oxo-dGTP pyrophosphatase MutT (NUDIX family)
METKRKQNGLLKDSPMKDMRWKVLSSEYVYKDNWFTARKDRCRMPSGKIVDPYYILEFPDWVNAAALTESGDIILVRQYRHALGETILEIPGGCMDPEDNNAETAMRRELLEETGYIFDTVENIGEISPNPSTNSNMTYMFLATGGKKIQEQQLDPNEEIEVLVYPPAEVIRLLRENKIRQSLHATCLFYAFQKLGWLKWEVQDMHTTSII